MSKNSAAIQKQSLCRVSQRSESTDYHTDAFYKNPIARALFMESGTALKSLSSHDFEQTNFVFVAQNFGCAFFNNSAAELDCTCQAPSTMIQNFVGQYQDSGATPGLEFGPSADERVIFSDYSARPKAGYIAKNSSNHLQSYQRRSLIIHVSREQRHGGSLSTRCQCSHAF